MSPSEKRKISTSKSDSNSQKTTSKNGKDKAKDKLRLIEQPLSAYITAQCELCLPIAPVYSLDLHNGIADTLNSLIMRYVPQLEGIMLAYRDVEIKCPGKIVNDSPFAHVKASFISTVWKPVVGQKLIGRINHQSPDHIGLLIGGTFNASIPREEIPDHQFKYVSPTSIPEGSSDVEGEWQVSLDGSYHSLRLASMGLVTFRVMEIQRDISGLMSVVGSLKGIKGDYSVNIADHAKKEEEIRYVNEDVEDAMEDMSHVDIDKEGITNVVEENEKEPVVKVEDNQDSDFDETMLIIPESQRDWAVAKELDEKGKVTKEEKKKKVKDKEIKKEINDERKEMKGREDTEKKDKDKTKKGKKRRREGDGGDGVDEDEKAKKKKKKKKIKKESV